MKIFICGRLGEVIKKVFELEEAIKESPTNVILVAELAAYNQVLSMWPVLDKKELTQAISIFRFNLVNLKEKEAELRIHSSIAFYDIMFKNRYFQALDNARESLAYINELGMYIGDSPMLEVDDANTITDN
jgi:hypothetical protein